jgi:hypothetical protein
MLLQTLVQLNILLLAAPALVGWAIPPAGHPLLMQAARVAVSLSASPVTEERRAAQASPCRAVAQPFVAAERPADVGVSARQPACAVPAAPQPPPFPHAARAP